MDKTNILDTLYRARLEKISKMNKQEVTMLGDTSLRIAEYENQLEECFLKFENEDLKNKIRELFEERIEIENEMSSYTKEKFYKAGFSEAIRLILKEIILNWNIKRHFLCKFQKSIDKRAKLC